MIIATMSADNANMDTSCSEIPSTSDSSHLTYTDGSCLDSDGDTANDLVQTEYTLLPSTEMSDCCESDMLSTIDKNVSNEECLDNVLFNANKVCNQVSLYYWQFIVIVAVIVLIPASHEPFFPGIAQDGLLLLIYYYCSVSNPGIIHYWNTIQFVFLEMGTL